MARSWNFVLLASLFLSGIVLEAQTKSSGSGAASTGGTSTAATSSKKKTTPAANTEKKSASTSKSSSTKSSSKAPVKRATGRRTPPPPTDQTRPTKDRYAEIQTALANAGYYSGVKDGNWNDQSVKALQQFQQDQNLEPTGKIDSLTLIRLNLGPHYDTDGTGSNAAAKPAG